MNAKSARACFALAVLGLLLAPRLEAYAFLTGKGWATVPNFQVDDRGMPSVNDADHGVGRVLSAITAWNGAGAGLLFTAQAATTGGSFAMGDGIPTLNFEGCGGDTCIALTLFVQAPNGDIVDADIISERDFLVQGNLTNRWTVVGEGPESNDQGQERCVQELYLDGVMVHEMGHALGMAHSSVVGATMFPAPQDCTNTLDYLSLEADDIAGIQTLYAQTDRFPFASFGFSCAGQTCTFDGSGSTDDHGISAYAWSFGDGGTGSGVTASHTFANGVYSVQLIVTDTGGQTASATRQVTVPDPPPTASFTFHCAGLACSFDGSGSTDNASITSYAWTWGDGGSGAGLTPNHTYGAPGTFSVTLTVTDNSGGTGSATQTAAVHFPFHTAGVYNSATGEFRLRLGHEENANELKASITGATGLPVAGDWNGDGVQTVGLFNANAATFYLRDSNTNGPPTQTIAWGSKTAKTVAGDWEHKHKDLVGVYEPATGTFRLRASNGTAIVFTFTGAASTWLPIAGDWNCDGTDTVGLYDPATSTFRLRNSNSSGGADLTFVFGTPGVGLLPVAGDWDGDGCDSIGVYNPATATFSLRNQNSSGASDHTFTFGPAGALPLAGDWDGI